MRYFPRKSEILLSVIYGDHERSTDLETQDQRTCTMTSPPIAGRALSRVAVLKYFSKNIFFFKYTHTFPILFVLYTDDGG